MVVEVEWERVIEIIRGWRDELQEGSDGEALESEAEGLTEVLGDEVRVERFCRSARLGDLVQDRGGSWAPRAERFDYHRNKTKTGPVTEEGRKFSGVQRLPE